MKHWIVAVCSLGLLAIGPSDARASLFTFKSSPVDALDLNLAIPENAVAGVNVAVDTTTNTYGTAILPGTEKIVDMTLWLNLTHTFMGDLSASLSFDGNSLVVMARPRESQGNNPTTSLGSPFGDGSNFAQTWLAFYDTGDGDPELLGSGKDSGQTPDLNSDGYVSLFPNRDNFQAESDYTSFATGLLSFLGQDPAGLWTINLSDRAAGDTGKLNAWQLDIVTEHVVVDDHGLPEPASLLLMGAGLAAAGVRRRFGRKSA